MCPQRPNKQGILKKISGKMRYRLFVFSSYLDLFKLKKKADVIWQKNAAAALQIPKNGAEKRRLKRFRADQTHKKS